MKSSPDGEKLCRWNSFTSGLFTPDFLYQINMSYIYKSCPRKNLRGQLKTVGPSIRYKDWYLGLLGKTGKGSNKLRPLRAETVSDSLLSQSTGSLSLMGSHLRHCLHISINICKKGCTNELPLLKEFIAHLQYSEILKNSYLSSHLYKSCLSV